MANKFTRFLSGVESGATKPKGGLGNWTHATRIFVDDTFRLSPRTKFLFYVQFELDRTALRSNVFSNRHADELGVLVKAADLPKFSFDSEIKNQYNRKKILYKMLNYDTVSISLHDDSAGIVNALWALYYGYYSPDRNLPVSAYDANHYRNSDTPLSNFRYGLDNNIAVPFFKSVSIYTMSRRRFLGYTLINPKIKSWQHGDVAYIENDTIESTMTLDYEAVKYSAGNVTWGNPKGFATLHYDTVPSPISVSGGGVGNLVGPGGVLDGLETIFGDISSGAAFSSVGGFIGTAINTINTYKNFKELSKESLKQEAVNILRNPDAIAAGISTIGGLVGTIFPKNTDSTQGTDANVKTFPLDLPPRAIGTDL